jgi:hypothetical protein
MHAVRACACECAQPSALPTLVTWLSLLSFDTALRCARSRRRFVLASARAQPEFYAFLSNISYRELALYELFQLHFDVAFKDVTSAGA